MQADHGSDRSLVSLPNQEHASSCHFRQMGKSNYIYFTPKKIPSCHLFFLIIKVINSHNIFKENICNSICNVIFGTEKKHEPRNGHHA